MPPPDDLFTPSKEFISYLKEVEGFSPRRYLDVNKPAIAYGHRIQPGESFPDEVDERFGEKLLRDDIVTKMRTTQRLLDAQFGKGTFANMPRLDREALSEFSFNGAFIGFPKFVEATVQDDLPRQLREFKRHSQGAPLNERNKAFHRVFLQPKLDRQRSSSATAETIDPLVQALQAIRAELGE
jgi:hypothetical protein